MRILLGCINLNGYGGSEMYHYELARELCLHGHSVTLFTLIPTDSTDEKSVALRELNVVQINQQTFNQYNNQYDLIVVSQPETVRYILSRNINVPIVSIIHSEIRSEDPVLDDRINHYIVIRKSIGKLLRDVYRIPENKITLIYNPIDQSRFNPIGSMKYEKPTGIFIGGASDDIRVNAVKHIIDHCIANDWDLQIMSRPHQRFEINHPNIKYIEPVWRTEHHVKNMHFTAGILLGRTTLEGWCCDVPGYMYIIDRRGNIVDIETDPPEANIVELCNSSYVCKQHIKLYESII